MGGTRARRRDQPAGNWPPYVRACLRTSIRFRAIALGISAAGTAFFAIALWLASIDRGILGIGPAQAALAMLGQFLASVFLALDLSAARRDHRQR